MVKERFVVLFVFTPLPLVRDPKTPAHLVTAAASETEAPTTKRATQPG